MKKYIIVLILLIALAFFAGLKVGEHKVITEQKVYTESTTQVEYNGQIYNYN